jgi:hypothetical protein
LFISYIDAFKVEAANAILSRLGKDVYESVRRDLRAQYKIELTKHTSFSLHDLSLALQELLGEDSTRLIMRTIEGEIDRLAEDQMR